MAEEKKLHEEVKDAVEDVKDAVEEAAEKLDDKVDDIKDAVEDATEKLDDKVDAAKDAVEDKVEAAMLSSTEAKRKKKAERREAKAARKEANKVEEKKRRPNNGLLAALIFGVLIVMFAFVGLYNYFSKPASIEKYMDENGIAEMYSDAPVDEHTTVKVRADGNTIKMLFTVAEDAPEEALAEYQGEDGKEMLRNMGASFLTSMKPLTQGLSGTVKVGVKQGDKTINYVKLSYREAKKVIKEAQEEEEDAEEAADEAADEAEEGAEDAADAAEDAAEEAAGAAADDAAESDGE